MTLCLYYLLFNFSSRLKEMKFELPVVEVYSNSRKEIKTMLLLLESSGWLFSGNALLGKQVKYCKNG